LKDTEPHTRLLVVGGGPTGIESAAEFAESFPQLEMTLATRAEILPLFPGKPRDYVIERLQRLGVQIRTHTAVAEVTPDAVITQSGDAIPFDVLLWAGGFRALDLARQSGLSVNERGQILVDPYQRSVSHPEVLVVGDASYRRIRWTLSSAWRRSRRWLPARTQRTVWQTYSTDVRCDY
jgi:NADH dehydrogenase FAD-containing subunit